MNSNRYEISFRLKISLRCSVSSLLIFTWIEAKWNSNRYGFHIGYFGRNEISNRHEISCEQNLREMKWLSANSLDIAFNVHVRFKLIRVWISYRSFRQEWNFISGYKTSRKHYPKLNAYTCPSKYWIVLKFSRNENSCEQNLFSRRFEISNQYGFISPLIWTYF